MTDKERYEYYKRIGVCPHCKKNKVTGKYVTCIDCRQKMQKYKKPDTRYQECKEKGICTKCRKEKAEQGKSMCRPCLDKVGKRKLEVAHWETKNNICHRCHSEKTYGHYYCDDCLEIINKKNTEYRNKEREHINNLVNARNKRLVEQRLCVQCMGKSNGHRYCANCRAKRREKSMTERVLINGHSRSERRSLGLCYFCGRKAIDGKGTCGFCKTRMSKNLGSKLGVNSNKIWKDDNKLIFRKGVKA